MNERVLLEYYIRLKSPNDGEMGRLIRRSPVKAFSLGSARLTFLRQTKNYSLEADGEIDPTQIKPSQEELDQLPEDEILWEIEPEVEVAKPPVNCPSCGCVLVGGMTCPNCDEPLF